MAGSPTSAHMNMADAAAQANLHRDKVTEIFQRMEENVNLDTQNIHKVWEKQNEELRDQMQKMVNAQNMHCNGEYFAKIPPPTTTPPQGKAAQKGTAYANGTALSGKGPFVQKVTAPGKEWEQRTVVGAQGVKMAQYGLTVERREDSILINGVEMACVPKENTCTISQVNDCVYVDGRLVYAPEQGGPRISAAQKENMRVERIGNCIMVNNLQVARIRPGELCKVRQTNGQVYVNGAKVYPLGNCC